MKILAIDGNSILNRAFYGIRPLTTKDGIPTNAIYGFLSIMIKLQNEYNPTSTVIAFDVARKTFRHEKYDQYKATRKSMPDDLAKQLPLIKEVLSCMGYSVIGVEGYEGDDILGTIASICKENGAKCVVATGDKDCLQLIDGDDVVISLAKNSGSVTIDQNKLMEEYKIKPEQVIELKALMGDASDNIPGVKGIGEKTANNLIQESDNIETIYADVEKVTATPRIKNLLEQGKEMAYISKDLATICTDVPLDRNIECYTDKDLDMEKLEETLKKLELYSFIKKLGVDNSEATTKTLVEVEVAEIEVEQLQGKLKDNVYVCCDESRLMFNVDGKVYLTNITDDSINMLSGRTITTYQGKLLVKNLLTRSVEFTLENDIELLAYLVSPDSKGYSIENLMMKYLDGVGVSCGEEYKCIAIMPMLVERLTKECEQEGMLELYQDLELPLLEVLASMELNGFTINRDGVVEFGKQLEKSIEEISNEIYECAGEQFNINSTKELGLILNEKLGLPLKKTKTGYSTNAEVLAEIEDKHEIVPKVLEYRHLAKLNSTYVVGLLKVIGEDNKVHSTFNQTETRTGRISSTEPNVQNIPVRTKLGRQMRKFFVAREGYTLIDADYSQIELRILAHISQDKTMIEAFEEGEDIHTITAKQVFGALLDVDGELRRRAKAINFGIVYGMGGFSLSKSIGVSVAEGKRYIEAYKNTYSGVSSYMDDIIEQAKKDGYVATIHNRKRYLADINSTNKMANAFAQRVALNAPIQGTSADIIKLAMVKVYNRLKPLEAELILQVHDELIVECKKDIAEQVQKILVEEMQNAVSLSVELLVEAHQGDDWYTAKG